MVVNEAVVKSARSSGVGCEGRAKAVGEFRRVFFSFGLSFSQTPHNGDQPGFEMPLLAEVGPVFEEIIA